MSLYGMMRTGVSGMGAQSNRLSTVADNIANSNTTGYKRAYTEFSSLVINNTSGKYSSGAVQTTIRNAISQEGLLQFTNSSSDLAISGNGFFVVQDNAGTPLLARAGSFVPDGQGRLVNPAGFFLNGYAYGANGEEPTTVANGFQNLEVISIAEHDIDATPSSEGRLSANLPADAAPNEEFKTSLVVYDNLGRATVEDITFRKTADDHEWEVVAPNAADGDAVTLTFDPVTGRLTATSENELVLRYREGAADEQDVTIDLSSMTQLSSGFTIRTAQVNGAEPSSIEEIRISENGVVSALYKNGDEKNLYKIALASVQSPDQLNVLPGNVFSPSANSGNVTIGFPQDGDFGSVISGALEGSNVDIAEELTNMIESQRNYTANSKVFQTGSDLLEILVNLKR